MTLRCEFRNHLGKINLGSQALLVSFTEVYAWSVWLSVVLKNKLTPAFYARVLLLMMNFLITLSKYSQSGGSTDSATPRVHSQTILTSVLTKFIINKRGASWQMALTVRFSRQKHSCRNIINFKLLWNVEV